MSLHRIILARIAAEKAARPRRAAGVGSVLKPMYGRTWLAAHPEKKPKRAAP